jgi:LCP family protein required for cell wall assembly
MSAPTSPYGSSSGRASIPPSGDRGSSRPSGRSGVPSGGYDGGQRPPHEPGKAYKPRRKPRWGRIALLAGIALVIIGLIVGISLYSYASNLDQGLKRTDAFSALTGERPKALVDGAQNILLLGSDSRDPDTNDGAANAWRSDTIILMHVPKDHKTAQLISIPRDTWVTVPKSDSAPCDQGSRAKINASFAFGGLPRAVHTVECLTGVRVDNVVAIDFGGFKDVVNAIGGVDLYVDQTITSIHKPHRVFKKGMMHMNGDQALDWVRQRKQFAQGDFARMRHQQEFLKALMDKAASTGTLSNPAKLNSFLKAVTAAVTVDKEFSLTDMALQFRSLRSDNLTFLTSPNKGSQTIAGQSVVVADRDKALALYKAMAADKMIEWLTGNQAKPSTATG